MADELGGRLLGEVEDDGLGLGFDVGNHAIDAAHAQALGETAILDLLAQVGGEIDAMLDDAAVHVHDLQGAIRGVEQVDGTEALVGGSDELGAVVTVATRELVVFHGERDTLDEVAGRLAHEDIAAQFWHGFATVGKGRARGGDRGDAAGVVE
jgi:hypothetical protein